VILRSRDRPTFHVSIGNVAMEQKLLVENLETVLKRIESHLDRGDQNIASVWVKTTMGKAVRV
jgi:large subunit ribosomal protein L1